MKTKAFTMLEMILAILIVAILGLIAIPKYLDLRDEARRNSEEATAASIVAGVRGLHAEI